jgi:hypothetical protein
MEPKNLDKLSLSQCYALIDDVERRIRDFEKAIFNAEAEIRRLQNSPYNRTQEHIDWCQKDIFLKKDGISFFQSERRRIQNKIQQLTYSKK